jgi:hypothetical protein
MSTKRQRLTTLHKNASDVGSSVLEYPQFRLSPTGVVLKGRGRPLLTVYDSSGSIVVRHDGNDPSLRNDRVDSLLKKAKKRGGARGTHRAVRRATRVSRNH